MKLERMKREYFSPLIEVIEVEVEKGFAMSVSIDNKAGTTNHFTTASFGSGNSGGSSMGDF